MAARAAPGRRDGVAERGQWEPARAATPFPGGGSSAGLSGGRAGAAVPGGRCAEGEPDRAEPGQRRGVPFDALQPRRRLPAMLPRAAGLVSPIPSRSGRRERGWGPAAQVGSGCRPAPKCAGTGNFTRRRFVKGGKKERRGVRMYLFPGRSHRSENRVRRQHRRGCPAAADLGMAAAGTGPRPRPLPRCGAGVPSRAEPCLTELCGTLRGTVVSAPRGLHRVCKTAELVLVAVPHLPAPVFNLVQRFCQWTR
ncbi:uncharacterized protein LOC135417530 [Pseudopipra pipra]|uniref:uncharacterized protein LOC135417530 n=1 Tax=Pseudopipra pipra TaxID=415032 RepID=UPI003138E461